jgi:hypothetical protein
MNIVRLDCQHKVAIKNLGSTIMVQKCDIIFQRSAAMILGVVVPPPPIGGVLDIRSANERATAREEERG